MTVEEARKEMKNLEITIAAIHQITSIDEQTRDVSTLLSNNEVGLPWRSIALHSVNAMCAYKNMLNRAIDNAEIKL